MKSEIRESKAASDRATEDQARTEQDGTVLTLAERKAQLRAEWNQEILPNVKGDPQFHYCWLSTTNNSDPVYKRLQLGYELVRATEIPGMAMQHAVREGEFAGCIAINEMILAKIHQELYQELMLINHHERPLNEEELLRANMDDDVEDSNGRRLLTTEGEGLDRLGSKRRAPKTFED